MIGVATNRFPQAGRFQAGQDVGKRGRSFLSVPRVSATVGPCVEAAVFCKPEDDQGVQVQSQRRGSLHSLRCSILGVLKSQELLGVVEGDLQRPPPGGRVLRRGSQADQLRQQLDRRIQGHRPPPARADPGVPAAQEPLLVRIALLPGGAAKGATFFNRPAATPKRYVFQPPFTTRTVCSSRPCVDDAQRWP